MTSIEPAEAPFARELLPEQHLMAAVLRQVVRDARSRGEHRAPARRWLRDQAVVQDWLDLAGFPERLYASLLAKAQMEKETR